MQTDRATRMRDQLETLLPAEWERLVRLCGALSGCADAAEDLAQETLIEAWRHADALRDPEAMRPWLTGIARNVCRRWARGQGHDAAKRQRLAQRHAAEIAGSAPAEHDFGLEHDELVTLLDRALGRLPAATREVLVQRYVDGRPHAEIAARLGMSEGAVTVRAHRGRLALQRALAEPELRAEAAAYGLVDTEAADWQPTRIWCPFCGKHLLEARIDREARDIAYRCAGRCFADGTLLDVRRSASGATALTSAKSILSRQLVDLHDYYRQALAERGGPCPGCGRPVALEHWSPSPLGPQHPYGIRMACRSCGAESGASLWHLLIDTPEAVRFWRRHPRIHALPVREVEVDGRAALVSGFASHDAAGRLEVVSARGTYEILRVDGSVAR